MLNLDVSSVAYGCNLKDPNSVSKVSLTVALSELIVIFLWRSYVRCLYMSRTLNTIYLELHFYVRYAPTIYSRITFISKLFETEVSRYDNRIVCPNPDIRH